MDAGRAVVVTLLGCWGLLAFFAVCLVSVGSRWEKRSPSIDVSDGRMPPDQRRAMSAGGRAPFPVRMGRPVAEWRDGPATMPTVKVPVVARKRETKDATPPVQIRRVAREAPARWRAETLVISGRACNPRDLLMIYAVAADFGAS